MLGILLYGGMAGGFGSYLLGMDQQTHDVLKNDSPGNAGVKNPGLGWMTAFTFVVSFVGIFSIVLLRKVLPLQSALLYSFLCSC